MRGWFSNLPLRPKLRLIVGSLAASGVVAVCIVYAILEMLGAWRSASAQLSAEASAVAQACAVAMDSNNVPLVGSTLHVLRANPAVSAATIRHRTGMVLGAAPEPRGGAAAEPEGWTARFLALTSFALDAPVEPNAARPATLHVEANFHREVIAALTDCLTFMAAVSLIAAALAAATRAHLGRNLPRPIDGLLRLARGAPPSGSLPGGLEGTGTDELGQLHEEINGLIGERTSSDR